jgi:hypothetical protein
MEKHAGGRPATIVIDEMVELVAEMQCMRMKKFAIKRAIEDVATQKIAQSSFEKLMRLARNLNQQRATSATENMSTETIGFYQDVIADPDAPIKEKLKAQEQLEHFLGLGARFKGSGESADVTASKIRIFLEKARNAGS